MTQTAIDNLKSELETPNGVPIEASHEPAGAAYWRSLEEYAQTPEFKAALADEFGYVDERGESAGSYSLDEMTGQVAGLSRRRFVKLAAASMALAGIGFGGTGCRRWPKEVHAPYAKRPDGTIPGTTQRYATSVERGGYAIGLLATAFDGRPIKVDGNPEHPFSMGASDIFAQASVLEIYDPERARVITRRTPDGRRVAAKWSDFQNYLDAEIKPGDGAGIAVLAERHSGPTYARLKAAFIKAYPKARWVDADATAAWDHRARPVYALENAEVIADFGADLLGQHPAALRHARGWAKARRGGGPPEDGLESDNGRPKADATLNRLYAVEAGFSLTGSVADHRLPVKPSQITRTLEAVAYKLGVEGAADPGDLNGSSVFVEQLVKDLKKAGDKAVVAVAVDAPARAVLTALAINRKLGSVGDASQQAGNQGAVRPVRYVVPAGSTAPQALDTLNGATTLIVIGGNPVYTHGLDLGRFETSICLSPYRHETASAATWHLPQSHFLEAWGDGRAWDGTPSLQQPLIRPLWDSRSEVELLALLVGEATVADDMAGYRLVRETWASRDLLGVAMDAAGYETAWRQALHDGVIAGGEYPDVNPRGYRELSAGELSAGEAATAQATGDHEFEVDLIPAPTIGDGRYANNGWLQELPETLTKLTWGNAALINIADARRLSLSNGDNVKLTSKSGGEITLPVYLMPGQARGTLSVWLGYGREVIGNVGKAVGVNAYPLLDSPGPAGGVAVCRLERAAGRGELAMTNNHYLLEEAGMLMKDMRVGAPSDKPDKSSGYVIKDTTLDYYKSNPGFVVAKDHGDVSLQLFPTEPPFYDGPHAWGMAIDMSTCIGCNACVIACQSENNIAVVGKDQVQRSREMHWLRIDRYFKTHRDRDEHAENPEVVYQPVACVHCENAPCEQVCPVAATVHDTEGLNTMIYNRCIGTRYCSNNCPYKVRRFNYYDYHSKPYPNATSNPWLGMPDSQLTTSVNPVRKMAFNPEVTVRMRGVMEKCTYCTQRIQAAKSRARVEYTQHKINPTTGKLRESEMVLDGEVVTACQESCPTQAIVFGNLNDPTSRVRKVQQAARGYNLLAELNTRPRTKHLAKLRNPDAKLLKAKAGGRYEQAGGRGSGGGDASHSAAPHA